MRQVVTKAIILTRIDYGEADRILTVLTPENGKLCLLAKGVRRIKSKLAGGIELFSISEITYIKGRGEMGTLVSARLIKHYENIVANDLERTMLGYELIKQLHRNTEDQTEKEYFELLVGVFDSLNDLSISLAIIQLWFEICLMRMGGREPNLETDIAGNCLLAEQIYDFDFAQMCFSPSPERGIYNSSHIKLLRLIIKGLSPKAMTQIKGVDLLAIDLQRIASS